MSPYNPTGLITTGSQLSAHVLLYLDFTIENPPRHTGRAPFDPFIVIRN